jgi:hypothetical protein
MNEVMTRSKREGFGMIFLIIPILSTELFLLSRDERIQSLVAVAGSAVAGAHTVAGSAVAGSAVAGAPAGAAAVVAGALMVVVVIIVIIVVVVIVEICSYYVIDAFFYVI